MCPAVYPAPMDRLLAALVVALPLAVPAEPAPAAPRFVESLTLGESRVWTLRDGEFSLEASILKGIDPAKARVMLGGRDAATTPVNAFLVQLRGKIVLVDTGAGRVADEDVGHLVEQLAAAGFEPSQVDLVLVTHFHFDHIGGLLRPDGSRAFPNASLRVSRAEHDYWMGEPSRLPERLRERIPKLRALFETYAAAGAFRTFEPGEELAPGIRALPAHGHTGGHTVYTFGAPGRELWCLGDLIHFGAVQFEHPEVGVSFDADGEKAASVREELFRRAADAKVVLAGAHLPKLVRLEPKGEGFTARPAAAP